MKLRILLCLLVACFLCGCVAKTEAEPTTQPTDPTVSIPTPIIDPLQEIVNNMTTEELVGQLFLARYPGAEAAITATEEYHIGGYVLFGTNTKNNTPEGLTSEIAQLQSHADVPLIISVDEEGGIVTRISGYSQYQAEPFPSPRQLYEEGGLQKVLDTEREKCQLLKSLGINTNLAPVCDITTDPGAFMYSRSLGKDPEETGNYIAQVVQLMGAEGVGGVLKHFPGYGNNSDTHTGTATDDRSLAQLEECDLVPFQKGIDAGCDAIMVSHTIVCAIDDQMPASLSPGVVTYLRENMGFEGVIVTDDLAMEAITDVYGDGEAAVLAVIAGADMLCSSEYIVQYEAVLQAVNDGRISTAQLMKSVMRILKWKQSIGLIP